jgi:hypothetical protein
MADNHQYRVFPFPYNWLFESDLVHSIKGCVQTLTNTLIRRIGEFIENTNDSPISCKSFVQYIINGYMRGQSSGTLHLNAIVKNPDMNVICYAIITM